VFFSLRKFRHGRFPFFDGQGGVFRQ